MARAAENASPETGSCVLASTARPVIVTDGSSGRGGTLVGEALGHTAHVASAELHGNAAYSTSWDLTLRVWAVPTAAPLATHRFERIEGNIAIAPDATLIATSEGARTLLISDGRSARLLAQLPTVTGPAALAFVDADHILAAGTAGVLELFDVTADPRPSAELLRQLTGSPYHLSPAGALER